MGKLAQKMDGPYRITNVSGRMFQRITMIGHSGHEITCHASKLTLYKGPVDESTWVPQRQPAGRDRAVTLERPPPTRKKRK